MRALLGAQMVNVLGGLLVGILLAREVGVSGQGIIQVTVMIPPLLAMIFSVGGSGTVTYLRSQSVARDAIMGWIYGLSGVVLGASVLVMAGWPGLFKAAHEAHVPNWLLMAGALAASAQTLSSGVSAVLVAEHHARRVMFVTLVPRLTVMVGLIGLLIVGRLRLPNILAWYWASSVLSAFASLLMVGELRGRWDGAVWSRAVRYGLRGHWGNLSQFLNYRVALLLIGWTQPARAAGWYWLALTLSELLWYGPQAAAGAWLPQVASGTGSTADAVKLVRTVGWVSVVLAGIGGLVAILVIPWVWGNAFDPAVGLLWALIPGVAVFAWAKVLASDIAGRGHPEWGSVSSVFGIVFVAGLGWWVLSVGGIGALALLQSAGYGISTAVLVWAFLRCDRTLRVRDLFRWSPKEWLIVLGVRHDVSPEGTP